MNAAGKESDNPRRQLSQARKIVVKLGSAVLTDRHGDLDSRFFFRLAGQISRARERGCHIALVTSGAVAAGMKRINAGQQPGSIPQKQAAAAVGQSYLMWLYERAFGRWGMMVAQVLLTHEDFKERKRYLNSWHTLTTLLTLGVVPVINENDTVAVEEIMLGDNDNLSAMLASLLEADLLIMLSDVEGLYQQDPRRVANARLIPIVEEVGADIERQASGPPGHKGVGGMLTKIQAAGVATKAGIATVIANGRTRDVITRILAGEEIGTLFLPQKGRLTKRKHWIAFVLRPKGALEIDRGAQEAILKRGKSLLASGIIGVSGRFDRGDAVDILSSRDVTFARGLSNYSASELERIKGLKSSAIEDKLGYKHLDEVIHRDNLVIW